MLPMMTEIESDTITVISTNKFDEKMENYLNDNFFFFIIDKRIHGGTVPTEIGFLSSSSSSMLYCDMSINMLNGFLPTEIFQLTSLKHFHVGTNNFIGTMPSTIGELTKLTSLNMEDSNLEGLIPTEIGHLSYLVNLQLCNNRQLDGTIPTEIGSLSNSLIARE